MGICQTCGGVNGQSAAGIVETINTRAPNPWAFVCSGHDEPRHDGKLDEVSTLTVKFEQLSRGQVVEISEDPKHWLWFSPQQALSLLAWLRQEEETLEKMARDEKGMWKG